MNAVQNSCLVVFVSNVLFFLKTKILLLIFLIIWSACPFQLSSQSIITPRSLCVETLVSFSLLMYRVRLSFGRVLRFWLVARIIHVDLEGLIFILFIWHLVSIFLRSLFKLVSISVSVFPTAVRVQSSAYRSV